MLARWPDAISASTWKRNPIVWLQLTDSKIPCHRIGGRSNLFGERVGYDQMLVIWPWENTTPSVVPTNAVDLSEAEPQWMTHHESTRNWKYHAVEHLEQILTHPLCTANLSCNFRRWTISMLSVRIKEGFHYMNASCLKLKELSHRLSIVRDEQPQVFPKPNPMQKQVAAETPGHLWVSPTSCRENELQIVLSQPLLTVRRRTSVRGFGSAWRILGSATDHPYIIPDKT